MKITYLGVEKSGRVLFEGIREWGELVAVFEVDFNINFKGTYSVGRQLFRVSLSTLGVNDEDKTILSVEEIQLARIKIFDQIKFEINTGL